MMLCTFLLAQAGSFVEEEALLLDLQNKPQAALALLEKSRIDGNISGTYGARYGRPNLYAIWTDVANFLHIGEPYMAAFTAVSILKNQPTLGFTLTAWGHARLYDDPASSAMLFSEALRRLPKDESRNIVVTELLRLKLQGESVSYATVAADIEGRADLLAALALGMARTGWRGCPRPMPRRRRIWQNGFSRRPGSIQRRWSFRR